MAKLTSIKPRLGGMKPRMGQAPADERERSRQRDDRDKWRSWYKTQRWRDLRKVILARDLYTCQRTGVLLVGKYPAPNSPVVDHKRPHRGDQALFWDPDNLHAISKAFHDSEKQREEQSAIKGVWY